MSEKIFVDSDVDTVCCDGGGGAMGHPNVYYSLAGVDMVECGYCDRQFIKSDAATATGAVA